MTETAEKLKIELSQLPLKERAEIAYFLLHSLDEELDDDVESTWDIELAQRMQEIHKGIASGESSNKVFTNLREKYS